MAQDSLSHARDAYEPMAVYYDAYSSHHNYKLWLDNLLPAAERCGLQGRRLLDLGCGSGKSFEPLLDSDWQITACDVSEAMLRQAEIKARGQVRLEVADIRTLPQLGCFDLVLCLGDVVNYLLSASELEQCFRGAGRNLASTGLLLFDLNTILSHRTHYGQTSISTRGRQRLIWRGQASPDTPPGSQVEARFEVLDSDGSTVCRATHRQRHYPPAEVETLLELAGLQVLAVFGHGFDAVLQQPVDESRHTKAIFIAKPTTHE
jgi:SAM-dependent methyltransferase